MDNIEFPEDVERMQRILRARGQDRWTDAQVADAWERYSERMLAGWLEPGTDDDFIFAGLQSGRYE